jgi:hypothetical protein
MAVLLALGRSTVVRVSSCWSRHRLTLLSVVSASHERRTRTDRLDEHWLLYCEPIDLLTAN